MNQLSMQSTMMQHQLQLQHTRVHDLMNRQALDSRLRAERSHSDSPQDRFAAALESNDQLKPSQRTALRIARRRWERYQRMLQRRLGAP